MCGMNRYLAIALGFVAAAILSGCNSGATGKCPGCPPVILVSFNGGDSQTIAQGQPVTITVTVSGDPSGQGVTWKLSGPGALSKQNSTSVEYDAPGSVANNATATITATAVADPTKSAMYTVTITPPPAISVSVSPASANVAVNATRSLTATVQNDSANKGVTWNLTQGGSACSPACGTVAPTSTASDALTTYTPPSTVPANATVTVTATSVADTTKSASASLTVVPPPPSISVSPTSALMGVNVTQEFTATVQNDPASKGVTWNLTQGGTSCSPACGTISAGSAPSGTPITYTAPATVPANATVNIIATLVADTSVSVSGPITVTAGTVKIVPNVLGFGRVLIGQSAMLNATVTNTGTKALSITSMSLTGPPVFSQTNTCSASVPPGGSCAITATFKPAAVVPYQGSISITDDSADSPQLVTLKGKGTRQLSPAMLAALTTSPIAAAPSPSGALDVGTRVIHLVDSSRREPYSASGASRELVVRLWYPASLAEGCKRAEYASPKVWTYFSDLLGIPLPTVLTNSCQDAPAADGEHPIVVFTHGYTGTFTDYTFLFEDLASRGYVVASVNHTYEATAVEFPNGRLVESVLGSHLDKNAHSSQQELAFAVSVRLNDLKFVVDELQSLNSQANGPFAGRLDTSKVAIAGHSIGGLTAILAMQEEPRFKAGIVLDGVAPDALSQITQAPVLLLSASDEAWSDSGCSLRDSLRGPRFAVNLKGAEHLTPTDAVWLARGAVKTGTMGADKTIAAVRDYIAAFLDTNLLGRPLDPLLAGPSPDYPDASVIKLTQSICHAN